jgi:phosphate uptake regulator
MRHSIADFFYLSWHMIRSLFKSRESLARENAEMRRQIAALKAEIEQAEINDQDEGQA